jgi:hypothetical protein
MIKFLGLIFLSWNKSTMIHLTYSFTSFESLNWYGFQYFSMSIYPFITSIFRIKCLVIYLHTLRVFYKLIILLITFLIINVIISYFLNFIYKIIFRFYCILIYKEIIFKILILKCVDLLWIDNLKFIDFRTRIQKITSSKFKTSIT